MNVGKRHIFLGPTGVDPTRRLRCKPQQGLDRRRGLRARLEFQDLTEQGQRDDHRSRLEVHRHPPHRDERRRKHARRHSGHNTVNKSRRGAQANQRPHVRTATHHRLHRALEERPRRPQHDRQRERELDPTLRGHLEPLQAMPCHCQHRDDDSQRQRPDEPPFEVPQLGALAVVKRGHLGLQRHAAFRARARMILPHLGVHRAGVGRTFDCGFSFGWASRSVFGGRSLGDRRFREVLRRISRELVLATRATEIEVGTFVLHRVRRLRGDGHCAHRVFQLRRLYTIGGYRHWVCSTAARLHGHGLKWRCNRCGSGPAGLDVVHQIFLAHGQCAGLDRRSRCGRITFAWPASDRTARSPSSALR